MAATTSKREIRVPARAMIADSYQLIGRCSEMEQEQGPVVLDASKTRMFGPFGIALLAASCALRRITDRETVLVLPNDSEPRDFVEEISFDGFIRGESPPSHPQDPTSVF
jgi:hypothetical protein